ncbi:MAG: secondary thiamine-phosphate synthase enzyme YjbQ [Planctomycetota bacterium]
MKAHTEYLTFETPERFRLVRITDEVAQIVARSGVVDGFALVSAMHITASVFVNDDESGLHEDMREWLDRLAPFKEDYRHHRTGEDNGDAHLKRSILGQQVTLPITNGALDLGTWEQVFYGEFDGRRPKRVIVKVMGLTA